jgi:hypothetical protein
LSCVRQDGAGFDSGTRKKFYVPQNCPTNLLLKWNRDFVGLKQLARKVSHLSPASAKVQNHLNLSSLYMILWNDREKLTFAFHFIYLVYVELELRNVFH